MKYERGDGFDGFDRGDLDWDYDAAQQADNEAWALENAELIAVAPAAGGAA
jgi:hypothetical protein